jgi:hypothetical protein
MAAPGPDTPPSFADPFDGLPDELPPDLLDSLCLNAEAERSEAEARDESPEDWISFDGEPDIGDPPPGPVGMNRMDGMTR